MKICAMSDLHGHEVPIPKCDVLAIAGDISKFGDVEWFNTQFISYLNKYKNKFDKCIMVFGNHDDNFMTQKDELKIPEYLEILYSKGYNYKGYIFWGSPFIVDSPEIVSSLYSVQEKTLKKIFQEMNPNTDVLITHSPPYGIGDTLKDQSYHLGSESLMDKIMVVQPKIHIFGHIHTGEKYTKGMWTKFYNVSILDDWYNVRYKPTMINL